MNFIGEFEKAVVRACHQRGYDGVVCGHIHHAEISQMDGLEYMNCGDWVESCTALTEDASGQFQIIRWAEREATPQRPRLVSAQVAAPQNNHRPAA